MDEYAFSHSSQGNMPGAYPELRFLTVEGGAIGVELDFLGVSKGVTGGFDNCLGGVLILFGVFILAFDGVCNICEFDLDFIGV